MKIMLLLKSLPAVAMAFYAVSKGLPFMKPKQDLRHNASPVALQEIRGTVVDTMRDRLHHFALIQSDKGFFWVSAQSGEAAVGQSVRCHPDRLVEDYESGELRMVLDKVYFADEIQVVS